MLVLAAVATVLGAATARPAVAHTELLQASPGPGQVAGGEIDFVDLAFLEPVSDVTVTVSRSGAEIPATVPVADGRIIHVELGDPLTEPGRYDVAYELTSADLDRTSGAFFFTYDPAATPARRIGAGPAAPTDRNWALVVTTIALGAVVLALAGRLALRLARLRSGLPAGTGVAAGSDAADDR